MTCDFQISDWKLSNRRSICDKIKTLLYNIMTTNKIKGYQIILLEFALEDVQETASHVMLYF